LHNICRDVENLFSAPGNVKMSCQTNNY